MNRLKKGTFGIFPAEFLTGLSHQEQMVLCWIWFHTNQDGLCWPSHTRLAEESGMSTTTVKKAIASLVEKRRLVVNQRFTDGRQTSNEYEVVLGEWSPDDHRQSPDDGGRGRGATTNQTQIEPKEDKPVFDCEEVEREREERQELTRITLQAASIWKERLGVVHHGWMRNTIQKLLVHMSEEDIMRSLRAYCDDAKPQYGPSPTKFAAVAMALASRPEHGHIRITEETIPE